jgi:phosphonatase-like hydrolase
MSRIELVAFDVAGTTVQEHGLVYATLEAVTHEVNPAVGAEDIGRWMGADKVEAVRALLALGGAPEPDEDTVLSVHATFRRRLVEAYDLEPPVALPGVEEAFVAFRAAGVRVALTTGFDHAITDPLLDRLGWRDGRFLDAVVCADDVALGRPAPYMIFKAMELTGVMDVARVLTAGDTPLDLQAGTHAGAGTVVGVLSGGVEEAVLRAEPHTDILGSVAEIPALLGLAVNV